MFDDFGLCAVVDSRVPPMRYESVCKMGSSSGADPLGNWSVYRTPLETHCNINSDLFLCHARFVCKDSQQVVIVAHAAGRLNLYRKVIGTSSERHRSVNDTGNSSSSFSPSSSSPSSCSSCFSFPCPPIPSQPSPGARSPPIMLLMMVFIIFLLLLPTPFVAQFTTSPFSPVPPP